MPLVPPGRRKPIAVDDEVADLVQAIGSHGRETHACCQADADDPAGPALSPAVREGSRVELQLRLPGVWPRNMSRRDSVAALEEIQRDKVEATYGIERLLDRLADKRGIHYAIIAKAVQGYAGDMLGDVFFEIEEELRGEQFGLDADLGAIGVDELEAERRRLLVLRWPFNAPLDGHWQ